MFVKGLIYDWDGVVLNSAKHISLARLERVVSTHGFHLDKQALTRVDVAWGWVGPKFIKHVFEVDDAMAVRLYHDWEMLDVTDPQPFVEGAIEAITLMHEDYKKSCIVSSRSRASLTSWFPRAHIFYEFVNVTCRDDTQYHKPDPRALDQALATFETYGIYRDECIFIGDTAQDILAGRGAGVRTLVVETGPYRESHAKDHPVDECDILPSLADLPRWVRDHEKN